MWVMQRGGCGKKRMVRGRGKQKIRRRKCQQPSVEKDKAPWNSGTGKTYIRREIIGEKIEKKNPVMREHHRKPESKKREGLKPNMLFASGRELERKTWKWY